MVVILIILVFLIAFLPSSKSKGVKSDKPKCPPHTWRRKNDDTPDSYLVCIKCKMLPGGAYEEGN